MNEDTYPSPMDIDEINLLRFLGLNVFLCYSLAQMIKKLLKPVLPSYFELKKFDVWIKAILKKIKLSIQKSETVLFFREFIKSPRNVGSIFPSSKSLALCMARQIPNNSNRFIVELGAGTGSVTEGLLKYGIDPARLILIEKSPKLARHLQKRFPSVMVIEGDASNLIEILTQQQILNVDAIISSLPFCSLPYAITQTITTQIYHLIRDNGKFIQFTYDLRNSNLKKLYQDFYHLYSKTVWLNFPPASVKVFVSN